MFLADINIIFFLFFYTIRHSINILIKEFLHNINVRFYLSSFGIIWLDQLRPYVQCEPPFNVTLDKQQGTSLICSKGLNPGPIPIVMGNGVLNLGLCLLRILLDESPYKRSSM